ncbi:hypothetical protein MNV49_003578 [Pseudohyphozyma bogoriensis]|nr:hypothetical protein MNV49_003578 [Pseudohyphozyma bogoriensis]
MSNHTSDSTFIGKAFFFVAAIVVPPFTVFQLSTHPACQNLWPRSFTYLRHPRGVIFIFGLDLLLWTDSIIFAGSVLGGLIQSAADSNLSSSSANMSQMGANQNMGGGGGMMQQQQMGQQPYELGSRKSRGHRSKKRQQAQSESESEASEGLLSSESDGFAAEVQSRRERASRRDRRNADNNV